MGKGNPRVRVDARVLEEYKRLADRLGIGVGELISAILEECMKYQGLIPQAIENWFKEHKRKRLSDYDWYMVYRKVRWHFEESNRSARPIIAQS